ncbi:MAG: FAD-binding protein [Deltaproteobacteria bacterium]|nr:FAD-binding protein [Deltaproteobacteria bacterium]
MEGLKTDLLVMGGGGAGSRAAYEAKKAHPELKVHMAVAGNYGSSGSTNLMASESLGINAPFNFMGDGDSPDVYYQDMLETGGGLSDPSLCRIIADEACDRISELIGLGVKFDAEKGKIIQRKLSGCAKARSLTCGGATGREIVRVLKKCLIGLGVEILENIRVLDLVKDDNGRVRGAVAVTGGKPVLIEAKAVILAGGGAGKIFRQSVNPPTLEGDGWCMAYRAGARLINMEFFQIGPAVFHPPILFIIHSHMWRLKPRLTNALGKEFLASHCPAGVDPGEVLDLKAMSYPFSVRTASMYLDIALFKEIAAGRGTASGGLYFDVTHVGKKTLLKRAPITYGTLKQAGADLAKEPIEIGMAVQNFNGGIFIDRNGYTGVEGLYAAGEISGGPHGADRPGGNNLIDTQVFGYRAGRAAAEFVSSGDFKPFKPPRAEAFTFEPLSPEDKRLIAESALLYSSHLSVVRTKQGLREILDFADAHRNNQSVLVRNRLLMGTILTTAALVREESRGTHYREDFPASDGAWIKRIVISRGRDGDPCVEGKEQPSNRL